MKVIERDVIVCGAGPGGSAAASYLARQGIDVLLLDKEKFPRDKPCADAQSGRTLLHVKELGFIDRLMAAGMHANGTLFTSGNYDKAFIKVGDGGGVITPRWIFDNMFREQAEKLGAEVLEDCWVYDVIREDGFIKGVKAKYNGEYVEFRSKIVIGADGSHSMIAKAIDMFPEEPENVTPALRTYFEGVKLFDDYIDEKGGYVEFHFDKEVAPGYIWIFPSGKDGLKKGFCNVGLGMTNRDLYRGKTLQQKFNQWVETSPYGERLKTAKQVAPWKGWRVPCASQRMDNYDNGVMLIGDAGSCVVPLIDEGVSAACDSAKMAADVAMKALKSKDYSKNNLKSYKEAFDKEYDDRVKIIKIVEASIEDPKVFDSIVYKLRTDEEFKSKAFKKMFRG